MGERSVSCRRVSVLSGNVLGNVHELAAVGGVVDEVQGAGVVAVLANVRFARGTRFLPPLDLRLERPGLRLPRQLRQLGEGRGAVGREGETERGGGASVEYGN